MSNSFKLNFSGFNNCLNIAGFLNFGFKKLFAFLTFYILLILLDITKSQYYYSDSIKQVKNY